MNCYWCQRVVVRSHNLYTVVPYAQKKPTNERATAPNGPRSCSLLWARWGVRGLSEQQHSPSKPPLARSSLGTHHFTAVWSVSLNRGELGQPKTRTFRVTSAYAFPGLTYRLPTRILTFWVTRMTRPPSQPKKTQPQHTRIHSNLNQSVN